MNHHTDPAINEDRRKKSQRIGSARARVGSKEQERHDSDVTQRTERDKLREWCARHTEQRHRAAYGHYGEPKKA